MERNRAILHTISTETPGDAELSRQLGRYQKQARTWLRVGLISIAGGVISFFTVHHTALKAILVTVLFFGGICCVLFLNAAPEKNQEVDAGTNGNCFFRQSWKRHSAGSAYTGNAY